MRQKTQSIEQLVLCGMFTALIAAGAFIKISIPVQPFPMHFTLQFFFVLLSAFVMGGRMGSAAVFAYLAVGLSGVPVFAAGGGPAYLVRPTFGFLLGFAGAAYTTGMLTEKLHRLTFLNLFFTALAGMAVMYLSGMLYFYFISNFVLSMHVTWGIVIVNCFLLTVGGDALLCALAAAFAVKLLPILEKIR